MNDYVAWLNGYSVARGTKAQVEAMARKVFATENFRAWEGDTANLKITRGPRQLFVKSILLHK